MNDFLKITGGKKIEGEVDAGGSKNAGFPVLAATVLLDNEVEMSNVSDIEDLRDFISILKKLGAGVDKVNKNSYRINPSNINSCSVDEELGNKIRGSYYLLGALLSKHRKASIPQPGGCNIGKRPMDLHLESLKNFGVEFAKKGDILTGELKKKPRGPIRICLPFPSRGATINSILTASLLEGTETKIINSDQSPEASSLVKFLQLAGLDIKRVGQDIHIKGVKKLQLKKFIMAPDKIEIASFLAAGLITNGEVKVNKIQKEDLFQLESLFNQIGAKYSLTEKSISVVSNQLSKLGPAIVISGLYAPCVDADYEPILTPILCKVEGNSIIDDTINAERHSTFLYKLQSIGANITEISGTRAIIEGSPKCVFKPSKDLEALDIRGGVAQLIAALTADGESILKNMSQIDRGYDHIEKKLSKLGADIKRVSK